VPLLGRFDPAFLDVPPEVIQLTAAKNQKYFVCRDKAGKLAPAFVCTANIVASDGGASIVAGNQKVLAARLSDARFFWEQDKKKKLEDHAAKLSEIVFHEKLGTVADKVERVAKLARWLVEEGIVKGADPALAEQAARLCKADLTTGMVGEFPELQGLMGGYYARAEGLGPQVADAIRDHYKPVGQGDDVPTAPVTLAVSLADKLDTLAAFYIVDERPTGSKDPFGLRRAGIAIGKTVVDGALRGSLTTMLLQSMFGVLGQIYSSKYKRLAIQIAPAIVEINDASLRQRVLEDIFSEPTVEGDTEAVQIKQSDRDNAAILIDLVNFMLDRLKVQQRESGVRHDLIDAVFALGGEDDLVRLLARVKALQAFIGTDDGANLLAGYKRAANILKAEAKKGELPSAPDAPTYMPEPAEAALIAALGAAAPKAEAAVAAEDFEGAMAALALLRAPIDGFFEDVTVNDSDPEKRAFRLALLVRVRDAVHRVADFSRIEG